MSATTIKTIHALIEAARVLFTRYGYERTTMTAIAREAKKGRRTLYMHFSSKEMLLRRVIETELDKIINASQTVANKDIPADRKIMELVFCRLDNVRYTVFRNGSLRADFRRFYLTIESIRRMYDIIEIGIIHNILIEGYEQGLFHFGDARVMAAMIHYSVKGMEVPYVRGMLAGGVDVRTLERHARQMILRGLGMDV